MHSDADAGLPFVREADAAVRLPGNSPADTYLRADLVLEAARRTGADAIHPGYGFLSENADFARAVIAAGLTWVGPAPESIEQMGSKIESKKLMEAAGVPVLDQPQRRDRDRGRPAAAGQGLGRRRRPRHARRTHPRRPARRDRRRPRPRRRRRSATAPSSSSRTSSTGRHVEVQVLGHRDGVLVLGERDCSIQRRHQKVVEEAPAPEPRRRRRARALHEAARAAAAAIDYRGAGTVEFLVRRARRERFFFLEMNTRLQVEHPVTELVHGVDLVELQLTRGRGRGRSTSGVIGETYGHAIEVRLYAEDPAARLAAAERAADPLRRARRVSASSTCSNRPGMRLDSGFESGSEVSTHYDAMLAKVIAWAPTREQAARMLADALVRGRGSTAWSPTATCWSRSCATRRSWPGRSAPTSSTAAVVPAESRSSPTREHLLFAAAVALAERDRLGAGCQAGHPGRPGATSSPSRSAPTFAAGDEEHASSGTAVATATRSTDADVRVLAASPDEVVLEVGGVQRARSRDARNSPATAGTPSSTVDGAARSARLRAVPRFVDPADVVGAGIAARADAGDGDRRSRRGRRRGHRGPDRCSCSRR